jgi:hypothetical protein
MPVCVVAVQVIVGPRQTFVDYLLRLDPIMLEWSRPMHCLLVRLCETLTEGQHSYCLAFPTTPDTFRRLNGRLSV